MKLDNGVILKRRFFIYNLKTGNCLSIKCYPDTSIGKENMGTDLAKYRILKPEVEMGEAFFIDDKHLHHTVPRGIEGVSW